MVEHHFLGKLIFKTGESFLTRHLCSVAPNAVPQKRLGRRITFFDSLLVLSGLSLLNSYILLIPMVKTRVGVLLRETVGGNKSNNRSVDLENLQNNQWPAFKKRLQNLIHAIQQHHGSLKSMEQTRQEVRRIREHD